jgi:hypothetical protein
MQYELFMINFHGTPEDGRFFMSINTNLPLFGPFGCSLFPD